MVQQHDDCSSGPAHIQVRSAYSNINVQNGSDFKDVQDNVGVEPQHGTDGKDHVTREEEVAASSSFPFPNVQVKNTFISVKDSSEAEHDVAAPRIRPRKTHHRCVSEPLWMVQRLCDPDEPMSLSQMVPVPSEGDDGDLSRSLASARPSLDIGEATPSDFTPHAGLVGFQHGRHLRQLSNRSCGSDGPGLGSEGLRAWMGPALGPDPRLSDPWSTAAFASAAVASLAETSPPPSEKDGDTLLDDREDEAVSDRAMGVRSGEDFHVGERSHLRQPSTQTVDSSESPSHMGVTRHTHFRAYSTQTADGFDVGFTRHSHF
jgi:hypothetical protein